MSSGFGEGQPAPGGRWAPHPTRGAGRLRSGRPRVFRRAALEGQGSLELRRVRSSTSRLRLGRPGVFLRAAPDGAMLKGENISPEGRGDSCRQGACSLSHEVTSPSMHAPSSCGLSFATIARCPSLSQWVAQHSVSDTAYRAAFVPCVRPVATAVLAARSQTSKKSNNSCWLEHGHPGYGRTKTLSTSTGSRVGRSPAGNDCAPALSHSPRGTSEDLHGRAGVRVVSLPGDPFPRFRLGCTWLLEAELRGINVSRALDSVVPCPGCRRRTQIGWGSLLQDGRGGGSGFWFWGRALGRFDLLSELKDAVTWVKKKGHSTAWVTDPARCSCTYSYGGRVHSPDKCDAAWPLLAFIWRGIAPLMRPWCSLAEEEVPGGVNLNLYSGGKACIPRHSDNEPLFGGGGDSKLIVSVSFGATATFRWARNSDRDGSSGWSQRLSHGDVLVMDGKAQDQFEHWTEAGVQGERINLTYRWIKQNNPGCVSATTGVLCCLPSCAEGLSVHGTPGGGGWGWGGVLGSLFPLVWTGSCPIGGCGGVLVAFEPLTLPFLLGCAGGVGAAGLAL